MNPKVDILKVNIDNLTSSEALTALENLINKRDSHHLIVTPNVDHIVRYQKDHEFRKIYKSATLVFADGVPLIWASKILKTPLKEKISGSDMFPKICELAANKGYSVFFLGGRPGAADKAAAVLKSKFPNLNVCGIYCPPLGFEHNTDESAKIINLITNAKPDILFVGLGSPKQEKWIYYNKELIKVPVSIGIGVSFEFIAGIVKRAPELFQKIGLEWFWRFCMEPRRLWKRYLITDMSFFWYLLKQKMRFRS